MPDRPHPEERLYTFGLPLKYKAFGVSFHRMWIEPTPGGAGSEWSVSVPDYVIEILNQEFPNDIILFGPGNQVGLYTGGSGLTKDGIIEVYQSPMWKNVYLMNRKEL